MFADIYRKIVPIEIRASVADIRQNLDRFRTLSKIKKGYYSGFEDEIAYMVSKNAVTVFPYQWSEKYIPEKVKVYFDYSRKLPYCKKNINGHCRRIYFPEKWSKAFIQRYFNSILCEQDTHSPHYYFNSNDTWFDKNTVFIDAGSAEGYISLQIIDKVKKVILFEKDTIWMKALEATFENWKDKVIIISKFVSDYVDENTTTIDETVGEVWDKLAIKVDVEGCEMNVIRGSSNLLKSDNVRAYICLYHNAKDQEIIEPYMKRKGFKTETSDSYFFYKFTNEKKYSFRHGVLKCQK